LMHAVRFRPHRLNTTIDWVRFSFVPSTNGDPPVGASLLQKSTKPLEAVIPSNTEAGAPTGAWQLDEFDESGSDRATTRSPYRDSVARRAARASSTFT
jgi:hypothetical protein